MTIQSLGGDHLHLACDGDSCSGYLTCHGMNEDELLLAAEERGWRIDWEVGLQFCPGPWHTIHECVVCGTVATNSVTPVTERAGEFVRGQEEWYCDRHWDPGP